MEAVEERISETLLHFSPDNSTFQLSPRSQGREGVGSIHWQSRSMQGGTVNTVERNTHVSGLRRVS